MSKKFPASTFILIRIFMMVVKILHINQIQNNA